MSSPPGLDLVALARFLAPHIDGLRPPLRAELIPGGRSNLTYIVEGGSQSVVLRRPPLAHVLPTAHDMHRESTVLQALRDTDIPVPRVVVACDDESVIGAPFYVMEYVDGHIVRNRMPDAFADTAAVRAAMSQALLETLVRLHEVRPDDVGLSGFGHPDGFLARQVRRWWQQWEASKTRELPAMDELHRLLEKTVPPQSQPGIVHGDYRLDNLMFAPDDPSSVVAVLDWEMSTVGDPLCDLGLLLVYWAERDDEPAARALHGGTVTVQPGFFTRAQIIEQYRSRSSRDLAMLDWYIALGAYKLAIIAEGINARFLMGMTVGAGFDEVGTMVPPIVEHALDLMTDMSRGRSM
ncbi:MAG TPA: phosphotransferase family protein [Candidatus Dormibacteraeota bacterium]|nr:phosphotransferase family protein [Candidatus Dormibacteraeota bacterium]